MLRISNARKFKNRVKFDNHLYSAITISLIIISLLTTPASGFDFNVARINNPNQDNGNDQPVFEESINYPEAAFNGYIFPSKISNYDKIALDEDHNGIEDLIDASTYCYSDFEYIDTLIILTRPASELIINKLENLGCRIDEVFTVIDGLGASIPITNLSAVGRIPGVIMVQSVHQVEHELNQAVPLMRATQDILKNEGYKGITGEGVSIAIIDSGIDGNHHTFGDRIIAFRDYIGSSTTAVDHGYHGTMCASCAAGSGTYKGVAVGANLIGVAVYNTYEMVQGIQWCVDNRNRDFNNDGTADGPDIISMSLGLGTTQRTYLDTAAERAMDSGIVFVTSAGNDGPDSGTITSPATSYKIISVGATNKNNKQIASFSSRGPGPGGIIKPDVVAPGAGIIVAVPNNQWSYGSGTSFSAPMVAGVCALLLQYDPALSPYDIKQALKDSAIDLGDPGPDNVYGWGFVDAVRALNMVLKVKSVEASDYNILEDASVEFTATASGTNVEEYAWDFNNDGEYDKITTSDSVSHTYEDNGTYRIRVMVTNTQGKTAENFVDIVVNNRKPDARLSIDDMPEYIYEDNTLVFNSSQSWDTPSDIDDLEFSWSFNDGSNFTNFSKYDEMYKYRFPDNGDYNIMVRVRDDNGEISETSTIIKVYNMKPIADAGGDKSVYEDDSVLFSGFNSYDTESDWSTLKYKWVFGDGTKGYDMNMTHRYQTAYSNETFFVTLTVTDNDNAESESKIKVTVHNRPPVITYVEDKFGNEDDLIEFTGEANDTINDVDKLKYSWDFDDGEGTDWLDEPDFTHKYLEIGTYHPRLHVKDPKGAQAFKNFNVTINNIAPTAVSTIDKDTAEEDEVITFDASESYDTESDIEDLKYIWNLGDGAVKVGKKISHRFFEEKRFTIQLTVIDNNGVEDSVEKYLTISNRKPTAVILPEKEEYKINELVRVFGHKSSDTSSDQLNLTYTWNFDDGTGWGVAGVNTTHRYSEPGEYEIRLKVEDELLEDTKKVKITVIAPKEKEDPLANPTLKNSGVQFYAGLGVLIIILILILVSLWMYNRNRKGLIGKIEKTLKESREKRKLKNEQKAQDSVEPYSYDIYNMDSKVITPHSSYPSPPPDWSQFQLNMQAPLGRSPPGPMPPKPPMGTMTMGPGSAPQPGQQPNQLPNLPDTPQMLPPGKKKVRKETQ